MRELLVGVDAGGTRTTAALSIDGRVARTWGGGSANPSVVGIEAAVSEIAGSIESVLEGERAIAVVAGVAGTGKPAVREEMEAKLRQRFPASRVSVCSDAIVALRAAIPDGDGIVAIAGTGSIVYAEIGDETLRAGGEGYASGDPGSGYAIGLTALSERAGMSVSQIAGHARNVLRAAAAGNTGAAAILETAANELYAMIETVALRCPPQTPLALAGGLLRERNALTERLERRINASALQVRLLEARVEPYVGALRLAALRATV